MKNDQSNSSNNQKEISNKEENIFNTIEENQKLKELGNEMEKLSLNSKEEEKSPSKSINKVENQKKNLSQKETPIIYNNIEDEYLKEMNKINLPIQTRERGRAKTNFPQKEIKQTPSYNNKKSSGSNPSPLYSYYDEYSKYLIKFLHSENENNQKNNIQFSSSKNVNPNRNKIINTINSITSPKGDSTNETPNYNDFNFFSNNNNNNNNKSPEINEINNNVNNNFNGNFIDGHNNINVINTNQFKNNNLNINYDNNNNNNNNYIFNFQKLNYGLEQGENQLNQFPNFRQMTLNSFPTNYQNQLYFQNNIMLNNDNSNNIIQQNQKSKLNPEDYIFEKFGKRGWQCEKCNNFNFESKKIYYIII